MSTQLSIHYLGIKQGDNSEDFLFFELLSIGQAVGNSSDAEKFINAAKDII
jgi:hypothetical protein